MAPRIELDEACTSSEDEMEDVRMDVEGQSQFFGWIDENEVRGPTTNDEQLHRAGLQLQISRGREREGTKKDSISSIASLMQTATEKVFFEQVFLLFYSFSEKVGMNFSP